MCASALTPGGKNTRTPVMVPITIGIAVMSGEVLLVSFGVVIAALKITAEALRRARNWRPAPALRPG